MSTSLCEIVSCPAIQTSLDSMFAAGQGNMQPESVPTLQYVLSEENRAGATVTPVGRPSKVVDVQVVYDQPFLTSEVGENGTGCIATDEECDLTATYTLDTSLNVYKSLLVSPSDLIGTCEENSAFVARKVEKIINVIEEKVSENLAAVIAAQLGAWSQDTANIRGANVTVGNLLQLNDYVGTSGEPNAILFQQLAKALKLSRFGSPIVTGGSALDDFFERSLAGGQAASGWNVEAMLRRYGFMPTYDRHVFDALQAAGDATNVAIGQGSIVPLGFSLFENPYNQMEDSTNIAKTIYSPRTGMKMDFIMNRPCATDPWNIIVKATYDFVTLPSDLYKVGSNYEGVKSLAGIEITCDDLNPCPAA
jgi:hypothetical protein